MTIKSVLKKKSWLKRVIEISSGGADVLLTYSGRGLGSEKVIVGDTTCLECSDTGWFVPSFKVNYKNDVYLVEVRIWPWFTLRSIQVFKNGENVYCEGKEPYKISQLTEIINLIIGLVIMVGFPCSVFLLISECIEYLMSTSL